MSRGGRRPDSADRRGDRIALVDGIGPCADAARSTIIELIAAMGVAESGGTKMACACVNAGKPTCAMCKEAKTNGLPVGIHACQWGTCS